LSVLAQEAAMEGRDTDERVQWLSCSRSPAYFADTFGTVYDAGRRTWVPFRLWPAQAAALGALEGSRLAVVLKARQLGMTWLAAGFSLWLLLFRPAATVLFFSRRDDEAVHLLGFRLRGMYDRLPPWLQASRVIRQNAHSLALSNGSQALAFPTTGGRSYTATLAVVDEADHVDDLDRLLDAVKPTVDAGGRLILLSTSDRRRPDSAFKRIYRAAAAGENGYRAVFLPWHAHPGRDAAWYAAVAADIRARTGGEDALHQEYPATDVEALAPRSADKFFPAEWLSRAWREGGPQAPGEAADPGAPGEGCTAALVTVFVAPVPGRTYVVGADPAEGNPQSDESAATVLDLLSGEQAALMAGRLDPAAFAAALDRLGRMYNGAAVLVERNNHGHAVLLWLREHSGLRVLAGTDGRPGWLATGASKPLAFDAAAEALRDGSAVVRDRETWLQLAAIEGTLRAAAGGADDRAAAFVLALAAIRFCDASASAVPARVLGPIADGDGDGW
jgi:hypothetical protein